MSVWKTAPVEEEPVITLGSWWVFAAPSPDGKETDHHFAGYNLGEGSGRISSKIVSFDIETRTGITRSGRKYQLVGSPGYNSDARYVFARWLRINNLDVADTTDVTQEYLPTGEADES